MPRTDFTSPGITEVLVPSAARASSGDTGPLRGWGAARVLRLQLHVSAIAGPAPTVDVVVEDSLDGVHWHVVGTFPRMKGVGVEVLDVVEPFCDTLRVRWTVGGPPSSVTFAVACYSE